MEILNTNLKEKNIILGSQSPRRSDLLKSMGLNFTIKINKTLETYPKNLTPIQTAVYLSNKKAQSYSIKNNDLLICADTIVYLKKIILEKPKSIEDAYLMLKKLSNKEHKVVTGVTIKTTKNSISFYDLTTVFFNKLSNNEINYYINHFNSLDKAGGYGIQEWIGIIGIRKISGSFYNVMGLPTNKLYKYLTRIST